MPDVVRGVVGERRHPRLLSSPHSQQWCVGHASCQSSASCPLISPKPQPNATPHPPPPPLYQSVSEEALFFSSPGGALPHPKHNQTLNPPSSQQGVSEEALAPLEERFRTWYANMSRAGLDLSVCVDARAGLAEGTGHCLVRLSGAADDAALRETAPLIVVNDLDLVPLGRGMRGDPPPPSQHAGQQSGHLAPAGGSGSFGSNGPGPWGRW